MHSLSWTLCTPSPPARGVPTLVDPNQIEELIAALPVCALIKVRVEGRGEELQGELGDEGE